MGWIGDPIWLEEVLRPALGERLRVLDGWRERGHGDDRYDPAVRDVQIGQRAG